MPLGLAQGLVFKHRRKPDPLAPYSFLLRLQSDRGIYKNTACTIPATLAGDQVQGWKDIMSGFALTATQATGSKCATLQFINGYPVLDWDGVDDEMRIPFAISDPYTITGVVRLTDPAANYPMAASTNCELRWHSNEGKAEIAGAGVTSTQLTSSVNNWIVSQGDFTSTTQQHFENGVAAVASVDNPIVASGIQIGNRFLASFFFKGQMTALTFSTTRPPHTAYSNQIPP